MRKKGRGVRKDAQSLQISPPPYEKKGLRDLGAESALRKFLSNRKKKKKKRGARDERGNELLLEDARVFLLAEKKGKGEKKKEERKKIESDFDPDRLGKSLEKKGRRGREEMKAACFTPRRGCRHRGD